MDIKILGTRGEIEETEEKHNQHSGVLIDNNILLDCGEKKFLKVKHKHILITHLHPDHAFFVRDREKIEEEIIAPEKIPGFNIKKLSNPINLDSFKVIPIPTEHSIKVKSQAYIIEHNSKRILYSGDVIWIDKKYWKKIGKVDLVITDGSISREGGRVFRNKLTGKIYGHGGIPNLIRLFSRFTDKIIFVHFGRWFYKDINESKRKIVDLGIIYGVDIKAAYDGMEVDL